MADNTILNAATTTGDTARTVQKGGNSGPKSGVAVIDWGGAGTEDLAPPDFATGTDVAGVVTAVGATTTAVGTVATAAGGTTTAVNSLATLAGAVTETAPASDTASSGQNGRLQRIAQRVTSLIALFPSSLGQKTKTGSLSVTLASDQDTLAVSGSFTSSATMAVLTPSIKLTASAYAAGAVLGSGTGSAGGSGVLTLTGAARTSGGTGYIEGIHLVNLDGTSPLVDVHFFSSAPASGTYTDKVAWAPSSGDYAKLVGSVTVQTSDWKTLISGKTEATLSAQGVPFAASGSANLYAIMVTQTAITPTGADNLLASFSFSQN